MIKTLKMYPFQQIVDEEQNIQKFTYNVYFQEYFTG